MCIIDCIIQTKFCKIRTQGIVEKRKFKCNRYRWTLSTRGIELLGKRESLIGSSVKKFWAKFRTREPLRDNWPLINGRGAIEFPATFSLRVHKSKRYDFVVSHPKIKLFSWKMKSCLGNHRYIYPFFYSLLIFVS